MVCGQGEWNDASLNLEGAEVNKLKFLGDVSVEISAREIKGTEVESDLVR